MKKTLPILGGAGAALIAGAAGYLFLIAPRAPRDTARAPFRRAYAHRGLHDGDIPENSLAAFQRAVDYGYGIELDLHLSRDGKVMVFHDDNLLRMTGVDAECETLLAEDLRMLRLAGTAEKIPYFSEVLRLVDGRVPLLIELKGRSATDMTLCAKVEELLREYQGLFCIESFNPMQVRWWKRNRPDIVRGQLVTNLMRSEGKWSKNPVDYLLSNLLLNVYSRPDFIAADKKMRNPALGICRDLFKADRFVWTVQGAEEKDAAMRQRTYPIFEIHIGTPKEKAE